MRTFLILYRDFLFRVVDRELLSSHGTGDAHRVFAQIAAILIVFSACFSLPAKDIAAEPSAPLRLFMTWSLHHVLIATTMLIVGLLAILSWGSMFPSYRDVAVLTPLPVPVRTIVLAKAAALVTALGLAVVTTHLVTGLVWPLALTRVGAPIAMPSFTRDAAFAPVHSRDLKAVLDRDLAPSLADGWLSPGAGGGLAIGISQHGARHVLTYGAARADSIFQIGSVTKTFTAFALARSVESGRVRLDSPVRSLLPSAGVPAPASGQPDIRLVDLATHRSGLPVMPPGVRLDRRRNPFANVRPDALYRYLQRRGLERPADAKFRYSNLGFGLLGHALAVDAGADYATLIRQVVAEPLGLVDTTVDLSQEQRRRLLQGYDDEGGRVTAWDADVLAGAWAMYSTVPDLLHWLEVQLHPPASLTPAIALMHRPLGTLRTGQQIGLAWFLDPASGSVSHAGAVGGYTAEVFFRPQEDLAIVVLTNRGPGVVVPAARIAEHIRARVQGVPALSLEDDTISVTGDLRSWVRAMLAYWVTMAAAGAFVAGMLIGLHGLAIGFLPRRHALRLSPVLQLLAFALLVGGYLLQPLGVGTDHLVAAQSDGVFSASPSYWFFGLHQSLLGAPVLPALATRAWIGVVVAVTLACLAYGLSFRRTLHGIAEQPDGTAGSRVRSHLPMGRGATGALMGFALKTLSRSAHPRMLVAFHWGIGVAFALGFAKTPRGESLAAAGDAGAWHETSVPLLVASILMMTSSIAAARSAFAMPRDVAANWIFRILPLREPRLYGVARRQALLVASVVPVSALSALVFFWLWPWLPALGHVVALALLGITLVEWAECGSRTIPFTCAYLPGRSKVHLALLVAVLVVVPMVIGAAIFERDALQDPARYGGMLAGVGAGWIVARCRTAWFASADAVPTFEAEPVDRAVTLDLWDNRPPSGTVPGTRSKNPVTSVG